MLAQLFPLVKDIRIICLTNGPDEDFMVTFAGEFLSSFSRLEKFHIFVADKPVKQKPEVVSEQRAQIGFWEKHNSRLNEVAMSCDVVWRKYGGKDWSLTDHEKRSLVLD